DHRLDGACGRVTHQGSVDQELASVGGPPRLFGQPFANGETAVGLGAREPVVAVQIVEWHGIVQVHAYLRRHTPHVSGATVHQDDTFVWTGHNDAVGKRV